MTPENTKKIMVDVNRASMDELVQLPGVGQRTAQAIAAGRPYTVPQDLLKVQGLGERSLQRIRPFLTFTVGQDADSSKRDADKNFISDETPARKKPTLGERLRGFEWVQSGSSPTSTQVISLVLIMGALSVFLSVLLSLAILAGINRTLNIERHAAVRELKSGFSQIEAELGDLAGDLATIDQRLKAVEGLSGRMTTLETEFDIVQDNVDQAVIEVDHLTEQVTSISDEVVRISGKVNLFDAFLEGMRTLMSDLFMPVETTPAP